MSENNDLLTFHNLLAENTRLKSEYKKLNHAYENAEKVATERLWEIRERRAENVQLKAEKDGAYSERNKLVSALSKIYPSVIGRHRGDGWDDDWRNVVYINIPVDGEAQQISWHIHNSELPLFSHLQINEDVAWDGHSTEEKYERLAKLHLHGSDK